MYEAAQWPVTVAQTYHPTKHVAISMVILSSRENMSIIEKSESVTCETNSCGLISPSFETLFLSISTR